MDTGGIRRSIRVRTVVKTFQSEQEQSAIGKKKNSAKVKVKPEPGADTLAQNKISKESATVKCQPIDAKADAEHSFETKSGKKRTRAAEPDEVKGEYASDYEQERPKKKKRTRKSPTATGQLYGAPPAGTIIP